jgi:hypothetical protein
LMQRVNIPHFKDIIIMSTNCEHCGYRDNEVKSGAAISEKGKKIVLKVEDEEDLSRDILKVSVVSIVPILPNSNFSPCSRKPAVLKSPRSTSFCSQEHSVADSPRSRAC